MTDTDNAATVEALGDLHAALAEKLAERVKSPDCTAAELTAAIAFLRANGITAKRKKDTPLDRLGEAVGDIQLPFEGDDRPTH